MTLPRLRDLCMSMPGATEQIQWGKDLVFKVAGKMFCVANTDPAGSEIAMSCKGSTKGTKESTKSTKKNAKGTKKDTTSTNASRRKHS